MITGRNGFVGHSPQKPEGREVNFICRCGGHDFLRTRLSPDLARAVTAVRYREQCVLVLASEALRLYRIEGVHVAAK